MAVRQNSYQLTSASLHMIAMFCMLLDHLGSSILPIQPWFGCIGRLAFPLFAFLLVEGYHYTHDLRKYMLRLLILAVLSEIPFDLIYENTVFYPFHQNVIWTFLIGLLLIRCIDWAKQSGKRWLVVVTSGAAIVIGLLVGFAAMVDYYGYGVWMVLVFYFFRGRKWWHFAGQLICLWYINAEMMGGLYYPITILGLQFELLRQSLAILALVPIWLYRGRQGYHSKSFQYFCYAFYPVHMLIIALIWMQMG